MINDLHAIMVSVDYTDLLRLTLPYNRHHFKTVTIVTSQDDYPNVLKLAKEYECIIYTTNAFYENGANFNKWLALERALDKVGIGSKSLRDCGWICLMDADILWPKEIDCWIVDPLTRFTKGINNEKNLIPGRLYTPLRHMYPTIPTSSELLPPESVWRDYLTHRNEREWAGYSQIFHTSDPVLDTCGNCGCHRTNHIWLPNKSTHCDCGRCSMFSWHATNWKHAGGADSFFQMRWNPRDKIRPNFNCLHLGIPGANWCGRTTPYADGSLHSDSIQRSTTLRKYMIARRTSMPGDNRFGLEMISDGPTDGPMPLPSREPSGETRTEGKTGPSSTRDDRPS